MRFSMHFEKKKKNITKKNTVGRMPWWWCLVYIYSTYVKKPMPSSSATRRFVVFLALVLSVLERSGAGFLKFLFF